MPVALRGRAVGKTQKVWRDALQRELNRVVDPKDAKSPRRFEAAATALVDAALDGDVTALKEIGDRIDGKPAQLQLHNGDEEGGPVRHVFGWQPSSA